MKSLFYLVLILCLIFSTGKDGHGAEEFDVIIQNVNLIDGTGKPAQEKMSVYIKNGRIMHIEKEPLENASSEMFVDGSGKYLIPGLIEAHAHPLDPDLDPATRKDIAHSFKTMIHYGVTSTLLLGSSGGNYSKMKALQQASAQGDMISPHIYYSSPLITIEGAHPMKMYTSDAWKDGETVHLLKDTSQVQPIIEEARNNRAIGVKLVVEDGPMPPFIQRISPELVQKVVEEAHAVNLPVFAHVSDMDEVRTCVEAGADHLVHFGGINIDWETDSEVVQRMADQNMSWITTLMLFKSMIYYRLHPEWLTRPEISEIYDSKHTTNLQNHVVEAQGRALLKAMTGSDTLSLKDLVTPMVEDLKKVQEMGVNVVVGTDVGGDVFILPGLSMHEEMELMQMGGLEPQSIIKMATLNGAKMLGIQDETGSVEEGKYADLVLLTENPLEDVSNSLAIDKVFKAGVLQPRISTNNRN